MRTTLNLPDGLVEEATRILGFKSKTEAVTVALREIIRKDRIVELKRLLREGHLQVDLAASRRR